MEYPKDTKIYALIDCNNFYVSCERAFQPNLRNKPVIVMSNNDGCVISRSNEVKALGIKMGVPIYQIKEDVIKHNIQLFSSNYTLYGDMSRRVMKTLKDVCPNIEVYSIDECFLDLTHQHVTDYEKFGKEIRAKILKYTGIPVSVGFAHTKTLSKVANHFAKRNSYCEGVLSLINKSNEELDHILQLTPIDDLWGVGRQYNIWLREKGITNAKQLKYSSPKYIKSKMTILGERMVLELNGTSCFHLKETNNPKKGIASTRAFGSYIVDKEELKESVAYHVGIASRKLRKQNSIATTVEVFIRTNPFREDHPRYSCSGFSKLTYPTSDARYLTKACIETLEEIYKDGYKYQKLGIIFTGIIPEECKKFDLFGEQSFEADKRDSHLMKVLDKINVVWGRGTLFLAREGVAQKWAMKRLKMSNRWTTRWDEILKI